MRTGARTPAKQASVSWFSTPTLEALPGYVCTYRMQPMDIKEVNARFSDNRYGHHQYRQYHQYHQYHHSLGWVLLEILQRVCYLLTNQANEDLTSMAFCCAPRSQNMGRLASIRAEGEDEDDVRWLSRWLVDSFVDWLQGRIAPSS